MSLLDVHAVVATAALFYMLGAGVLGVGTYVRKQGISPAYRGVLAVAVALVAVVGLLGVAAGARPEGSFAVMHVLYGTSSFIAIPAVFTFTRGATGRREALLYGLTCWFIVGLLIRASMT